MQKNLKLVLKQNTPVSISEKLYLETRFGVLAF